MVSERHKISLNAIRDTQQKLAASVAGPLFEVRSRNRRVEPVSTLDNQLDSKARAHRTHEVFVAIRFNAANPMVQMRGHDTEVQSLAEIEQSAGKCDGISAARKANEYR
jgi:hypothetical protein